MPTPLTTDTGVARDVRVTTRRLLVTWQDPKARAYHPVGFLTYGSDESYTFSYLDRARRTQGFFPLLGLDDLGRVYHSEQLFAVFQERVMDRRRATGTWLQEALALPAESTGPFEILARTGGARMGDTIELLPVPTVGRDGSTSCEFFVHGVRRVPGAIEALAEVRIGSPLDVRGEPDNEHDERALLVTAASGQPLGYVPQPLLEYVHAVEAQDGFRLTALRVHPTGPGDHFRLLVELAGHVPTGYQPFAGMGWELAAHVGVR